jgi:hypothetical protein
VCHSTTVFEADHNGLVTKAVTVADSDDKKASASADVAFVYDVAVKPIFEAARAAGTMPPMVDRAGMAGAFEHVPLELAQNAGAATVAAVTRTRHAWVSTLLARHIGFDGKPLGSLVRYFFRVAVWAGGAGARKKKEEGGTGKKEEKKEKKKAAAAAGALAAIPERGAGEMVLPKRKRGGPKQRRPKGVRVDAGVVEAVDVAAADQEREAGGDFATIDMMADLEALAVHEGCAKARVTVAVGDVPPSRSPVVQALADETRAALIELACRFASAVPRLLAADSKKKTKKPPSATPMTAAFVSLWQRHLEARMAFAASVRERGCV